MSILNKFKKPEKKKDIEYLSDKKAAVLANAAFIYHLKNNNIKFGIPANK